MNSIFRISILVVFFFQASPAWTMSCTLESLIVKLAELDPQDSRVAPLLAEGLMTDRSEKLTAAGLQLRRAASRVPSERLKRAMLARIKETLLGQGRSSALSSPEFQRSLIPFFARYGSDTEAVKIRKELSDAIGAGLDARGARYRNAQWDDSVLFHQNVLDYERPLYARPDLAFILRNQDLRAAVLEVLKTDPRYFSRMMGHPLLYSQQRRDMVGVIRDLSFGPELRDLPGETVKMLRSMVEPFTGDPATRSALEQFDRILANKDEGAIGEVQRFLPQDTHSPVTAPSFLERLKGFLSDRFGRTDSPKPANLIEVDFSKKRPKP